MSSLTKVATIDVALIVISNQDILLQTRRVGLESVVATDGTGE